LAIVQRLEAEAIHNFGWAWGYLGISWGMTRYDKWKVAAPLFSWLGSNCWCVDHPNKIVVVSISRTYDPWKNPYWLCWDLLRFVGRIFLWLCKDAWSFEW
jgi:hypothetical protein